MGEPFTPEDLKKIQEFYLLLRNMDAWMKVRGNRPELRKYDNANGVLAEIVERAVNRCVAIPLATVTTATDGETRLRFHESMTGPYEEYIFRPAWLPVPEIGPLIMGSINQYYILSNTEGKERSITIGITDIVKKKGPEIVLTYQGTDQLAKKIGLDKLG